MFYYIILIVYFYVHLFMFLINLYDVCAQPVSEKFSNTFRYLAVIDELAVTAVTFLLIFYVRAAL